MKKVLLLIYLGFINYSIFSQSIDATKIEINFQADSNPQNLITVQSGFFFTSTDGYSGDFGRELWFSDGTITGTNRVKDINLGNNSSNPSSFTLLNNILFFTAYDRNHGKELWKSDGTEAGTVLIKDIRPDNTDTYFGPTNLVTFNEKVYFNATDGINGTELWVSDGTEGGTYMIKDINTNGDSHPGNLFVFNNTLFFTADNGSHLNELWKSDGTEIGTILIKNNSYSNITNKFIISGNQFFFYAYSNNYNTATSTGYELWKSDGTETGTILVKDIKNGSGSSNSILEGIDLNGTLIFSASDGINGTELWKSDGTETGTILIKNINNSDFSSISYNNLYAKLNNEIYFLAEDNTHGKEIWKTDGTESGTKLVKDINGGNSSVWIEKFHVDESNSKLLFYTTSTNSPERELWSTDGTDKGTIKIPKIETTNSSSTEEYFCNFDGKTFFSGKNQINGNELFVTDGTIQETKLFKDLNYNNGSSPAKLTDVNGKIFFAGTNEQEYGNQLFSSDGTIDGTIMVKRIGDNSNFDGLSETVVINNKLFFSAHNNSDGYEPWISDGTEQGTFMVKDIRTDGSSLRNYNNKQSFFSSNNLVYFSANDGIHGFEPWVSNGTEQGTFMLKDIITEGNGTGHDEEGGSSNSRFFTELNNYVYFISNSSLWKTDGTKSGTEIVYSNNNLGYLNKINNKLLFYANGNRWTSDGTTNGTSITNLPSYLNINSNIELNNELYFISRLEEITNRYGLYKTNGTKEGTTLLLEGLNHPTISTVAIGNLIKCGKYIYFTLTDYWYTDVPELWRTDGNITEKIDIDSGINTFQFECHKENLFYTTNNINELKYINDNLTSPNSLILRVPNNENFSNYSPIYNLTSSGDNLYFTNTTDLSGSELFVITPNISTLNTNPFQDHIESNKLNIFPNPTNKLINIKSQTHFNRITIYNLDGRLIMNEKIENTLETKLNVDSLTKGVYLIEIISGDKKHFQKLIIE